MGKSMKGVLISVSLLSALFLGAFLILSFFLLGNILESPLSFFSVGLVQFLQEFRSKALKEEYSKAPLLGPISLLYYEALLCGHLAKKEDGHWEEFASCPILVQIFRGSLFRKINRLDLGGFYRVWPRLFWKTELSFEVQRPSTFLKFLEKFHRESCPDSLSNLYFSPFYGYVLGEIIRSKVTLETLFVARDKIKIVFWKESNFCAKLTNDLIICYRPQTKGARRFSWVFEPEFDSLVLTESASPENYRFTSVIYFFNNCSKVMLRISSGLRSSTHQCYKKETPNMFVYTAFKNIELFSFRVKERNLIQER